MGEPAYVAAFVVNNDRTGPFQETKRQSDRNGLRSLDNPQEHLRVAVGDSAKAILVHQFLVGGQNDVMDSLQAARRMGVSILRFGRAAVRRETKVTYNG